MSVMLKVTSLFSRWTHIGDDGDEGVGNGKGEALWSAQLKALLHKREAMLPAEQTDVTQQMERYLHILVNKKKQHKIHLTVVLKLDLEKKHSQLLHCLQYRNTLLYIES